ncbi:uncharacterized protein LOC123516873 [Portunus trituberculatus]|uniref:uncharacterized protein LOC123516873 n=1 Tax=Portunus trituberculatus TaxID=210409 RepID=UPI001E1CC101|nr:uncharacterized protein LOC123516873 [Portunus trituberculatus]
MPGVRCSYTNCHVLSSQHYSHIIISIKSKHNLIYYYLPFRGWVIWICERLRKTGLRCMVSMIQRLPGPLYKWATWCRHAIPKLLASQRYRALLLASLIMASVLVLAVPIVPEKLLGIRTREQILDSFNGLNNSSLGGGEEATFQPFSDDKTHHVFKRHIPHKFWARARPHNKFKKKKLKSHGYLLNNQMSKRDFETKKLHQDNI